GLKEPLHFCGNVLLGEFHYENKTFKISFNQTDRIQRIQKIGISGRAMTMHYHTCGVPLFVNKSAKITTRAMQKYGPYFIPILVVVDHANYLRFKKNKKSIISNVKKYFKSASEMMKPLGVTLSVADVVIWDKKDEIKIVRSGDATLNNLQVYFESKLMAKYQNCVRIAHLLINVKDLDMAGRGFVGSACTLDHAVSFTWTKYTNYDNVQYTAHELSHNLGMAHDTPACKCGKEKMCTMAMGNKGLGKKWSDCSLNEYNTVINNQDLDCLKEKLKQCK
ncbi:hypothetical protein B4U80_11778, partial [Leptotrombidium deliense]